MLAVCSTCGLAIAGCAQVWEAWDGLRGVGERRRFCKEAFVSFETMEAIGDLRRELYMVETSSSCCTTAVFMFPWSQHNDCGGRFGALAIAVRCRRLQTWALWAVVGALVVAHRLLMNHAM